MIRSKIWNMDSMESLLQKSLHKRGLYTHAQSSLVVFKAQEWLEKELSLFAEMIHARSYTDAILIIECDHSIALQECSQQQERLKTYLVEECGISEIHDIRIIRS